MLVHRQHAVSFVCSFMGSQNCSAICVVSLLITAIHSIPLTPLHADATAPSSLPTLVTPLTPVWGSGFRASLAPGGGAAPRRGLDPPPRPPPPRGPRAATPPRVNSQVNNMNSLKEKTSCTVSCPPPPVEARGGGDSLGTGHPTLQSGSTLPAL